MFQIFCVTSNSSIAIIWWPCVSDVVNKISLLSHRHGQSVHLLSCRAKRCWCAILHDIDNVVTLLTESVIPHPPWIFSPLFQLVHGQSIDLSSCGAMKGCFTNPTDCARGQCDTIFTWEVQGDKMKIELAGRIDGWVAIGFSNDQIMVRRGSQI